MLCATYILLKYCIVIFFSPLLLEEEKKGWGHDELEMEIDKGQSGLLYIKCYSKLGGWEAKRERAQREKVLEWS